MSLFCDCQLSEIEQELKPFSNNEVKLKNFHTAQEMACIDVVLLRLTSAACSAFGITRDALKVKTRKREVVMARQMICFLLWQFTRMSLMQISERVNKHHATILYSHRTILGIIETDRPFREFYQNEFEPFAKELTAINLRMSSNTRST